MNLLLVPLDSTDDQIVSSIYNSRYIHDMAVLGFSFPESDIYIKDKLERWLHSTNQRHFKVIQSQTVIGLAQIFNIDFINRKCNIGILLEEKYQGNGLGSTVINKLMEICFNDLNLNKIEAHVIDYNQKSISLIKKTGFIKEGIHRESVYKQGEYRNVYSYGILKKEYL